MIQFHETIMGKRFFEGQLPSLIKTLEKLTEAQEAQTKEIVELREEQHATNELLYEQNDLLRRLLKNQEA